MKEFLNSPKIGDECRANVLAAMHEVQTHGLVAARHLRGDIYEVRADCEDVIIRVLFAEEGTRGQVLLAVEGFVKKTQQTPDHIIRLAEQRLADWRSRGQRLQVRRGQRPPGRRA